MGLLKKLNIRFFQQPLFPTGHLFIKRPVSLARPVVGTLLIHAKSAPCTGAENFLINHIMHADRYSQYRGEGDQVGTDMSEA